MPTNPLIYSRDCYAWVVGDRCTVTVSDDMVASGWPGGIGVMWVPGVNDERTVGISDGRYGGFCLFGSSETPDQLTSLSDSQQTYRYATFCAGGWLISTSTYERYTYASRIGGGALVPLTYSINDVLFFSLRGYWTRERELDLSGAGSNFFTGFVAQVPKASTNYWLGIQTGL